MYGFNPYSAAPYSALSGGVVIELTGVSASGLVGNETPNFVAALSGVSATGTVADVIAVLGVSLTGVSASGSAGTATTLLKTQHRCSITKRLVLLALLKQQSALL